MVENETFELISPLRKCLYTFQYIFTYAVQDVSYITRFLQIQKGVFLLL